MKETAHDIHLKKAQFMKDLTNYMNDNIEEDNLVKVSSMTESIKLEEKKVTEMVK